MGTRREHSSRNVVYLDTNMGGALRSLIDEDHLLLSAESSTPEIHAKRFPSLGELIWDDSGRSCMRFRRLSPELEI